MEDQRSMHGVSNVHHSNHLRLGNFSKLFDIPETWIQDFEIEDENIEKQNKKAEEIAGLLGGPGGIMHDSKDNSANSSIPAAYTFFAQFIDHDITLEASTKLHQNPLPNEEINDLPNFRSASLDLDSVYGFGPDVSPHLYDPSQPGRLVVGSNVNGVENPDDLPRRGDGVALLGDHRNDENLFLSQMHLLFLRFHNRLLIGHSFEEAQREARYHYQYIVLNDFLNRVCNTEVYEYARQRILDNQTAYFNLSPDGSGRLPMPVEFAGAAYRFGHTMVRSQYPVNENYPSIEIFDERFGTLGFSQVPPKLTVDWSCLLDVRTTQMFVNSKALDHLLADELVCLPPLVAGRDARPQDVSLAFRNLRRGYVLSLPSGQRVLEALSKKGYPGIPPDSSLDFENILDSDNVDDECKKKLLEEHGEKLKEHTPLFFYLMVEAGTLGEGERLGPVGSAILMEVFGAMLLHHRTFITAENWEPDGNLRTLADVVRYVSP